MVTSKRRLRPAWEEAAALMVPRERTDAEREAAEAAVRELWASARMIEPRIVWARSPQDIPRGKMPDWDTENKLNGFRWADRHPVTITLEFPRNDNASRWTAWNASVAARESLRRSIRLTTLVSNVTDIEIAANDVAGHGSWEAASPLARIQRAAIGAIITEAALILVEWPVTVRVMPMPADRRLGPNRFAEWRLGDATRPAVEWRDGHKQWYWQGREVTEWLLGKPELLTAMATGNTEARREAIQAVGWQELVTGAGMTMHGEPEDDPGNPGQKCELWVIPEQIFGKKQHVVRCWNATEEPDGTRRGYMLFTSSTDKTPVASLARLAQLTAEQYRSMARAT